MCIHVCVCVAELAMLTFQLAWPMCYRFVCLIDMQLLSHYSVGIASVFIRVTCPQILLHVP